MDKGLPAHPGVNLECLLEIFEVSTRKMQTFSDLLESCSLAKYYYFKFSLEHQNVRTERDHGAIQLKALILQMRKLRGQKRFAKGQGKKLIVDWKINICPFHLHKLKKKSSEGNRKYIIWLLKKRLFKI